MDLPIGKVKDLYYKRGLSAREVGEKLEVSVWQVISFMKRNDLARRDQVEIHHLAFLAAPRSFKIKRTLTNKEKL
jgi:DNA-binding transcriptional regulator LsrR (DeoR family)